MAIITLPLPGNPQYQDDPTQVVLNMAHGPNVADYFAAAPGQWFYGVVHTLTGNIYLVPGNVHDDPLNAQQQNPRMLNTYASKAPVPLAGWQSLSGAAKYHGIGSVPTGHNAVAAKYGLVPAECLGFRVIKLNAHLATFTDRSNTMNGTKLDRRPVSVVPQGDPSAAAPPAGVAVIERNAQGYGPSDSARMPPQWAQAVRSFLSAALGIQQWAVDF